MPNFNQNARVFSYLADNLSKNAYDALQDSLGISRNKLTRLESGQDDFDLSLIHKLSQLIPGMSAGQIIHTFKIGRSTMSLAEADALYLAEGGALAPAPIEIQDEQLAA